MPQARALSFWISRRSVFTLVRHVVLHLQQLGEAEDRLQRVVDLVGDAGDELADGGEPLLADDLALQRLSSWRMRRSSAIWASSACRRVVEAAQHQVERHLQLGELARQHRLVLDRAEVAGGDALRGAVEMADRIAEAARQHQRDQPASRPGRARAPRSCAPTTETARCTASDVGMPTLTIQGPASTTASPYIRVTPSSPMASCGGCGVARRAAHRPAERCGRRSDRRRGCGRARGPRRRRMVTTESARQRQRRRRRRAGSAGSGRRRAPPTAAPEASAPDSRARRSGACRTATTRVGSTMRSPLRGRSPHGQLPAIERFVRQVDARRPRLPSGVTRTSRGSARARPRRG